ncbi:MULTISPECIES: isocitrate lyase/phosphoenolpyruvate mutase family protein [unclassified Salinibacterium]|uniref:isocitrate lyase/PEP mutase family protein n=1 Tax=unclassified Salinibacterium TaxID=2632331 RepID=UPI0018CEA0DA|nr:MULTISPECIES: isocitrate lyase/phosphoenolpyruvate mutase family protein [unclassified Salinibacterium]MBH0052921.1 isocitrate lyase/phosphoenolpyruvate mutase family protein [Salinibacterium sp. SWN139]MBH0082189.1 isocitrate lyase/phosphoenolpyruvate mutase family protein [Salinibacterium sp. SWN167]
MTEIAPSSPAARAELLRSLHIPGTPLIVSNVWDAITARVVAEAPGVRALATASHAVSFARGVSDGEGLTVDQAIEAASIICTAVEIPVSVDFEKGYSPDADGVQVNVERLIAAGAAGLNIEDSSGPAKAPLFDLDHAAARVAAARAAGDATGVPIAINARVDVLAGGGEWDDMVARANTYLAAGADCIFVLGLTNEQMVAQAIAQIDGPISVIGGTGYVPLKTLAELGVARVSFGPRTLGLTLSHLQQAATQLTALGDYPEELGFVY